MVLHTVNKSPLSHQALANCLKVMGNEDSLLLIEDGVYGALAGTASSDTLAHLASSGRLHVLSEDVNARGLTDRLISNVSQVDYAGFVDLVASHESSMAWL